MFALRFLLVAGLALIHSGCGFQPLYYHEGSVDLSVVPALKIARIADRTGQQIRNRLLYSLNNHSDSKAKITLLVSPIVVTTNSTSVRRDGTTARYRLVVSTTFKIIDNQTNKTLFENNATAVNAYSIGENSANAAYSTLTAAQDAQDKALNQLADQITYAVISHFQNADR